MRQVSLDAYAGVGMVLVAALSLRTIEATPQGVATASGVASNSAEVDQFLTRFQAAIAEYDTTFRNLTAEETKVMEVFQASGKIDKRRQVVSDLVVYHSPRAGSSATAEYRDALSVDGKVVKQRGERALKLLTEVSTADSLEQELAAINRETLRYEFSLRVWGYTIHQPGAQLKPPHESFRVEWVGRETIAGREVVVLDYQQTGPLEDREASPPVPLPKELILAAPFVRGRLWLDAGTGQLRQDMWEKVVVHPATPEPLVMLRRDSTYRASELGILVPERLVFEWWGHFSHPKNAPPSFALTARTTFTYAAFKRFGVVTTIR